MSNKAEKTLKEIPKDVDPNVLKIGFYDLKAVGVKLIHNIGRGIREYGYTDFDYYFVKDPTLSLLSQPDDPNFCLGSTTFKYGKDREPVMFIAYGPPSRVLDAILGETDKKYHEEIILKQTTSKLNYITKRIDHKISKAESEKKLGQGIETLLEGFKKKREAEGKPEPKIFTKSGLSGIASLSKHISEEYYNPLAFKSAKTKDVINEGIYKYLTPAEILTQRISQTNTSIPNLANKIGFDISTVYHHVRGTRDVDRKAALRYASFFNCDPADILFPPIKINLTGTCDLLNDNGFVKIKYKKDEQVLCPRDFYSNAREIKSIRIKSSSSVYNDHVAYYYYTNKKEADCENKICFIGVKEKVADDIITSYFIGIYENYRGRTKILNADPYRNKEVILENPNIEFITPIIAFVDIEKVNFSPIVDVKFKKITEDEKLKKIEKELELSEQQWWIENQKLSGKNYTSPGKAKAMDKMYKDLRALRVQYQDMKYKLAREAAKDVKFNKDFDQKMDELFGKFFDDGEKQKQA